MVVAAMIPGNEDSTQAWARRQQKHQRQRVKKVQATIAVI